MTFAFRHLFIIYTLLVGLNLWACECECNTNSFEKACTEASEIFVGKIVKYERSKYYQNAWKITFEVAKKWKGTHQKYISVYSLDECGLFDKTTHHNYLIYAYQHSKIFDEFVLKDAYVTWICSRSVLEYNYEMKSMDWYEKDLVRLDKQYATVWLFPKWLAWPIMGLGLILLVKILTICCAWRNLKNG